MSKPDPAGGSLESILASIRKSLSEQSTDALTEEAAAAPAEAPKPEEPKKNGKPAARREGLTQRLAGATPDAPRADKVEREDDLAGLVEEPLATKSPSPVSASAAAAPARSEGDPLWFLTRAEPGGEANAGEPPPAAGGADATAGEPTLTRPEVVRASLPPFFGSSAEAAKAEAAPVETVPPVLGVTRPPAPPEGGSAKATSRAVSGRGAPPAPVIETAVISPGPAAGPPMRNGRTNSLFEPAGGKPASPGETPHIHALEAVVLDLLRPMLRQWLDENMPRLVSAALAAEAAARSASPARDPKKP